MSGIDLLGRRCSTSELRAWNDTAVNEGTPASMVSLFEAQVARVPDRNADDARDATLTYAQLDARANQLAHQLHTLGVQDGQPVGLLLDRNATAVVGLMGIMKAAGAYTPLSVDAPPARIADQVREAGIRVIVTDAANAAKLPQGVQSVVVDSEAATLGGASLPAWSERNIDPSSVAYVLFTSGSTGTPKGVAVTHANAVHYTRAVSRVLGATDGIVFGLMSTLAADLGNTSLFPSLLGGGTLHVFDKASTTEPARFAAEVEARPLDILKTTPNLLEALTAGRRGSDLAAILPRACIVLGGEPLRLDFGAQTLLARCNVPCAQPLRAYRDHRGACSPTR